MGDGGGERKGTERERGEIDGLNVLGPAFKGETLQFLDRFSYRFPPPPFRFVLFLFFVPFFLIWVISTQETRRCQHQAAPAYRNISPHLPSRARRRSRSGGKKATRRILQRVRDHAPQDLTPLTLSGYGLPLSMCAVLQRGMQTELFAFLCVCVCV